MNNICEHTGLTCKQVHEIAEKTIEDIQKESTRLRDMLKQFCPHKNAVEYHVDMYEAGIYQSICTTCGKIFKQYEDSSG